MELHRIVFDGYEQLDNIYSVPMLEKEFSEAVNEYWLLSPPWKRYQRKLVENLVVLGAYLEGATQLLQFEKLINNPPLYSIRHPNTPKNVRVIYSIEDNCIILLHAFLEKNSSDYKRGINIAKHRLNELNQ